MSAPIGSNFVSLTEGTHTYRLLENFSPSLEVVHTRTIKEKPVKAYKIRNVQTGQYWSGGRWRKTNRNGRVWTRMCDVKNVLNNMSQDNFCKAEVVDYVLMPSTQPVVMLDDFNKVLDDFKVALQKAGKPV